MCKNFSQITASCTLVCCLIIGNHLDIRKVAKNFSRNTETFLKLQQIIDMLSGEERNRSKTPEEITSVVYLHVIRVTATEKELMLYYT